MNFYDCCDLTKKSIFNAGTQVSLHITWYIVQYVFTVQYLLPLCAYCCICSTHRMVFWLQRHTLQQLSSSYRNWNLLIACTATMIKRVADKCICSSSHTSDWVETEQERERRQEKVKCVETAADGHYFYGNEFRPGISSVLPISLCSSILLLLLQSFQESLQYRVGNQTVCGTTISLYIWPF